MFKQIAIAILCLGIMVSTNSAKADYNVDLSYNATGFCKAQKKRVRGLVTYVNNYLYDARYDYQTIGYHEHNKYKKLVGDLAHEARTFYWNNLNSSGKHCGEYGNDVERKLNDIYLEVRAK